MNTPSAEDFLEASTLATLYEDGYKEHVLPLVTDFVENFYEADIKKFVEAYEQTRSTVFSDMLAANQKTMTVLDWFDSQPAIVSVFGKVKEVFLSNRKHILINGLGHRLMFYYMIETEVLPENLERLKKILCNIPADKMTEEDKKMSNYLSRRQEQYIQQLIEDRKPAFTLQVLSDLQSKLNQKNIKLNEKISFDNTFSYKYPLSSLGIDYSESFRFASFISELARMANCYITKAYLERVTVSKDRIDKIINLLSSLRTEVELIQASKWCPDNIDSLALPYRDKMYRKMGRGSIERLREIQKEEISIIKRKDQTVQERLMVVDLIRTYKRLFYYKNIDKRDVFKLMELPFIKNLIEMKTIERIIATEKARQEEKTQRSQGQYDRKISD